MLCQRRKRTVQRNWRERYYTFSRLEGEGRSYELLGFRILYRFLTSAFEEPCLPDCDTLQAEELPTILPVERATLQNTARSTRYHEMVNLLYSTATLPLVLLAILSWHFWLCLYASLLFLVHLLCAIQERYKRALCLLALRRPASDFLAVAPPAPKMTQKSSEKPLDRWGERWFTPFRFETLRLYHLLGVEWFRKRVLEITNQTILDADQRRGGERTHFVGGTTSAHLRAYAQQTRVSEMIHLTGVLLHLPFLWYFAQERLLSASAYVLVLNGGNLWCALLQRYHRLRIAPLLRRHSRQAMKA